MGLQIAQCHRTEKNPGFVVNPLPLGENSCDGVPWIKTFASPKVP
jgi:hypothetical protein